MYIDILSEFIKRQNAHVSFLILNGSFKLGVFTWHNEYTSCTPYDMQMRGLEDDQRRCMFIYEGPSIMRSISLRRGLYSVFRK
jgi:hypothetical protein